ncbi:toxin-antitoxin system YwqK family antitoxin [Fusobacterium nucleatum]|uniref:toxin-antitoxin system YwqK family antitoxin n=1 Tax=Fusobacterium nucleatum TaxID=851 RepID=UPI0030CA68A2
MKKNFIICTFIIFLLASFTVFAEREVDLEKLEYDDKSKLVYLEGENEPFTGIAKDYYKDKSLKIEFPYKNGKMEGRGKEYYPSGKFKSDAFFVDGLLQGKSIGYYENGQVYIQESYKNGELDGESLNFDENGNLKSKEVYKNGELVESSNKNIGEVSIPSKKSNTESKLKYYIGISAFLTVIIGLIVYTIFKMLTAFPKTNHLSDEQRSRIFKILMKYDEGKDGLFSAYRMNGVGTGYYRVRSMMVDNEKVYIYAKMFSILYIPTPITLGYLLCYNKDKILASFSNTTFKEAKKEIEETILHL